MKKTVLTLFIVILAVVFLHAFRAFQQPVISGSIYPKEAVKQVVAFNGKDSVISIPDKAGLFAVNVTPGVWKLIVEAKEPYKTVVMESVKAREGEGTNIAVITLHQ